jgi:hypothetical protein
MEDVAAITDLKVRVGYGIVGNQQIRDANFVSTFGGGLASTAYAIGGANTVITGLTGQNLGNPNTSWEEKTTTNFGIDLTLFDGKFNAVLDLYTSEVNGLLYNPALPQTAGQIGAAFVNIAEMQNNGMDFSLNWRPDVGKVKFDITANVSQYTNEITKIDGNLTEFFGNGGPQIRVAATPIQINRIGESVGSFFGLTNVGIWQSQAEIDAANALDGDASTVFQDGAAPGRLRWADINGFDPETGARTGQPDGKIDDADIDIIGTPHPDFTAGLNIGAKYKNLDFSMFLFGSFGNQIFNATKQFTIFRTFNTNADTRLLTDAWSPDNTGGTLPALDVNDNFSSAPSSFYVEDGSYVRLKQLQIGYTLPQSFGGDLFSRLRIYVQGQNLFTITDYSGLDPALSSFGKPGSDADDLFQGVDIGNYPSTRVFLVGVNAAF